VAAGGVRGLSRETYDAAENLRLALIHLVQAIGGAARQLSREFTASIRHRHSSTRSSRNCGPEASTSSPAIPTDFRYQSDGLPGADGLPGDL
jgi:hypothetical protein